MCKHCNQSENQALSVYNQAYSVYDKACVAYHRAIFAEDTPANAILYLFILATISLW